MSDWSIAQQNYWVPTHHVWRPARRLSDDRPRMKPVGDRSIRNDQILIHKKS